MVPLFDLSRSVIKRGAKFRRWLVTTALLGLVRDIGAPVRSGLPAGIYGARDGGVKRHRDVLEAVPDGRAEGMGALDKIWDNW